MLTNIAPLARTAMDKQGGRALADYSKKIDRMLDKYTPWRKKRGWARGLTHGKNVEPGEVMVLLDAGDSPNDPLFKGAKTTRE